MSDSLVHFIAGAGGGVISSAVMYPLNNVATRLQVQNNATDSGAYRGTWDTFQRLVREEGILSLYAGFSSGIAGVAVSQGVFYYAYELIREKLASPPASPKRTFTNMENLVIGAVAGVITAVATNPIWVLNTRMSTIKAKSPDHSKSSVAVLLEIVAEEGPLALFKGVVPGLILVTNPAIQYMVFERLRAWTESHRHAAAGKAAGKLTDLDFFWLGLLSKFVASTVTYPLILVKSKLQAKSTDKSPRYTGTWQAMFKIMQQDGPAGLFQGYGPRIVQSVLTSAILFLAKEKLFLYTVALLQLRKPVAKAL